MFVSVIVTNGKAYLTTDADSPIGFFSMEPAYLAELTADSLAAAIRIVKDAGNPEITEAELSELRKEPDPTLKATGKKSWTQLGREGATYGIHWLDERILLSISRTDEKGRWVFDDEKSVELPLGSSIEAVVQIILEDVQRRPEVF